MAFPYKDEESDPRNKTLELLPVEEREKEYYVVTDNSGNKTTKTRGQLTDIEKKAADKSSGIVPGGKTDIENKYAVVSGNVGVKPIKDTSTASTLADISGVVASTAMGASTGGLKGALIGAAVSTGIAIARNAEKDKKYREALKEFNERVSENSTLMGSWEEDEEGNKVFVPDYSKLKENINVEESGAKVNELFNLEAKEPEVYFDNNDVLRIDINRTFADTKKYRDILDAIGKTYPNLSKNASNAEEAINQIKEYLGGALSQYVFEVNRVAAYREKLPNADTDVILDAAQNEIGATLDDEDKKDWVVKVYRDGEIVNSNAEEVLDNVYNMKDKYERDDYLETLADLMSDDSISDNDKAYILSEYNLLFSASNADVKEEEPGKSSGRKKYSEMLNQDFFVTVFKSSGIIEGADSLFDGIASAISSGEVDDILIADQNYLSPDEMASNFGAIAGTAFDVYVTQKAMNFLENKAVRPALGKATQKIGKSLISTGVEPLENIGEKLINASWTPVIGSAGETVGYRTALDLTGLKTGALANIIQAFNGANSISYRLVSKGATQIMAWSLGELAINFTADAIFDAAKLGTEALSGRIESSDAASKYMWESLGQDLVMDIILQYGPQGMLDIRSTADAVRLQHVEPFAQEAAAARTKYGEALEAMDSVKRPGTKKAVAAREKLVEAQNNLSKAEAEYHSALKKWGASKSSRLGAKIAGIEAKATENELIRKFQEAVLDENASGTALARAAYAVSGGDVNLFNKLMNSISNNLPTLTRITFNELASDKWADGTGEALNKFKQTYSDIANYNGNLSDADINYIKAKNELIRYTEAAQGDKKKIKEAEAFYSKYISGVDAERAAQLDGLMDAMREVVNKTNESAVNAGVQTEENIQTKRSATGFQSQGYIPMYLKRKKNRGSYTMGQERNLEHTWDRGDFWELDSLENPVLNTLTYVNYTARNIAVNERNKAIIAATEIPGMRTYRTDIDDRVIRTKTGNHYKHSDVISNARATIVKESGKKIKSVKKTAPSGADYTEAQDEIAYGKSGESSGLRKSLSSAASKARSEQQRLDNDLAGDEVVVMRHTTGRETGLKKFSDIDPRKVKGGVGVEHPGVVFAAEYNNRGYERGDEAFGGKTPGESFVFGVPKNRIANLGDGNTGRSLAEYIRNRLALDASPEDRAYYEPLIGDLEKGVVEGISDPRGFIAEWQKQNGIWFLSGTSVDGSPEYVTAVKEPFAKEAEYKVGETSLRKRMLKIMNGLIDNFNSTYSEYGFRTSELSGKDYARVSELAASGDVDKIVEFITQFKDSERIARPTDSVVSDSVLDKLQYELNADIDKFIDEHYPDLSDNQKSGLRAEILDAVVVDAIESKDKLKAQVARAAKSRSVGYPITYYEGGEERVAYIAGPLAKPIYEMTVRSENVTDRNFIQRVLEFAGKLKRYATTTIDVTRALPNLLRDTIRGDIFSGGVDYAGAKKYFAEILDAEGLTVEQKNKAMAAIDLATKIAQGQTLNAAVENRTERGLQDMVRETRQEGKNVVSRIIWDVAHGRIGHALETPMNIAEMSTRRRMAQSAFTLEFKNAKYTSSSFEERLDKAYQAGVNSGIENTTNFSRRGAAVGAIARYVPYFQQNFANIESANNAFLKDPAGVACRAAMFQYAYMMMLAETLKREETRKAYYNLSDYDRKNNIVFSLDNKTLVTIPLDETLASLITPWRRTMETLNNVDPGTFAGIFTESLLDLSPLDLDGFTEGDSLNVRRGLEKVAAQAAPSLVTELVQTLTGYSLYYGSSNAVTDETLGQYGKTAESAGDYTTIGANSKLLRAVADATGIPQWMLQQTVSNFGGSVGQYVLNTLDKLAGASKTEQGGKDFIDSVFKSMTGSDGNNARNQFYSGIDILKKDKEKLIKKLNSLSDEIATASGDRLTELKAEYQSQKDGYAKKVSDFVSQYLSAYEITGGLEKSQASQIYYLFNLYDDDTAYETGSVGEYYQNLAKKDTNNEASTWAAPILDKYYDQTQNVYKDSNGAWHYSSPYGEKAFYNTIYGQGMKHQVGLRNLIEGKTSGLSALRDKAYKMRSAAIESGNYDLYDQIGADFDAEVVKVITPYINENGRDNVLKNSTVLDFLEEWFFVPSSYMKTKRGYNVPSLANNASKQRAFVRSYIKDLYGVDTGYESSDFSNLLNPEVRR